MSAPLIGITGRRVTLGQLRGVPATMATAGAELHLVDYARSVAAAGGIPVQLSHETPQGVVDRLDGLVLSGGGDVDPRRYGAGPGPGLTDVDPRRDEHELALYDAARRRGLPVLGICRGCQVINVAHGGTLVLDLPTDGGEGHASFAYPRDHRAVQIELVAGSRPASWYGPSVRANCIHHQAIDRPGDGVQVVGAAADGVVEAIEVAGAPVVGVQWHPEMFVEGDPAFDWLIAAAGRTVRPVPIPPEETERALRSS